MITPKADHRGLARPHYVLPLDVAHCETKIPLSGNLTALLNLYFIYNRDEAYFPRDGPSNFAQLKFKSRTLRCFDIKSEYLSINSGTKALNVERLSLFMLNICRSIPLKQ